MADVTNVFKDLRRRVNASIDASSITITFTVVGFGFPDIITRSSGSWADDGFKAGDSITFTGTTSNNNTYTCQVVGSGAMTTTATVTNETVSSGTVTASIAWSTYTTDQDAAWGKFRIPTASWTQPTSWETPDHWGRMLIRTGSAEQYAIRYTVSDGAGGDYEDLLVRKRSGSVYNATAPISKAIAYDSTADSYTDETDAANNATVNDMTLLPASASVGDMYYFLWDTPEVNSMDLTIGTSGSGTWTIVWEYNTNITTPSWSTLPGISDGTTGFTATAGVKTVSWTAGTDLKAVVVDGLYSGIGIRARVTAYTSMTTQPLGTQVIAPKLEITTETWEDTAGDWSTTTIDDHEEWGTGVTTVEHLLSLSAETYDPTIYTYIMVPKNAADAYVNSSTILWYALPFMVEFMPEVSIKDFDVGGGDATGSVVFSARDTVSFNTDGGWALPLHVDFNILHHKPSSWKWIEDPDGDTTGPTTITEDTDWTPDEISTGNLAIDGTEVEYDLELYVNDGLTGSNPVRTIRVNVTYN